MKACRKKFLALGHLTIDELFHEGKKIRERMGGSVAYGSLAAASMGWKASIVSVIGEDMPESFLHKLHSSGVDLSNVRMSGKHSTRFQVEVSGSRRVLSKPRSAPALQSFDIPRDLKDYDIFFFGPIGGEIGVDLIDKIRKEAKGIFAVDLQGFLRKFSPSGEMILVKNEDALIACSYCDVVHLGLEEYFALTGTAKLYKGIEMLLDVGAIVISITMGERGAIVADKEKILHIPAIKPKRVVDDVGAGDVFLAVLSVCIAENKGLVVSSAIATAAASLSIELDGPHLLNKNEIDRMSKIVIPLITRASDNFQFSNL